jgi:hypothetical protein
MGGCTNISAITSPAYALGLIFSANVVWQWLPILTAAYLTVLFPLCIMFILVDVLASACYPCLRNVVRPPLPYFIACSSQLMIE